MSRSVGISPWWVGIVVSLVACSQPLSSTASRSPERAGDPSSVRIVFVGDVMMGRGVGDVVSSAPDTVFDRLRPVLSAADLALANLESPLTVRSHALGPNALEADPVASPALLSAAGFDAFGIANNHAGDAGPSTVDDTVAALASVGIATIGAGVDTATTETPWLQTMHGVQIAVLAFDLTLGGPAPGEGWGVARWDRVRAERAVRSAAQSSDVVIVGLHGGVEYLPRPDPVLRDVVEQLSAWGADVVWGHGAHVVYPVAVVDGPGDDGRVSVQAPGLGNALFDQGVAGTERGAVLEVLVDVDGVVAHRTGSVGSYLRSSFDGWDEPMGDVALEDGGWWSLDREVATVDRVVAPTGLLQLAEDGTVVDAVVADVTGDGADDVVAAYRTPFHDKVLHAAYPGVAFEDASGRAAHVGVFDAADGRLLWGAGTMPRPVGVIAGCDGSIAVAFVGLDDARITGGGAWTWRGFGFATAAELDGSVVPACADIDGDGATEPLLLRSGGEHG